MIRGDLMKLRCLSLFRGCELVKSARRLYSDGNLTNKKSSAELFFDSAVQNLLIKLTGFDLEKIYSVRRDGERLDPPKYLFMQSEEYDKAMKDAVVRARDKLQMPPVLDRREGVSKILAKDDKLSGYTKHKYVFTDISYGVDDRERNIVIRDEDGTLRLAEWSERDRMNQIYFPRASRKLIPPKLFQRENLKSLLERGEYLFVLDSACCQFEPDDPVYIDVCEQTYSGVDNDSAYNILRSTRHYGPFVFYLARNNKIDNLLVENLATDRLDDAVCLISLYHLLNSESKSAKVDSSEPLKLIKSYIELDSPNRDKMELTFQTYREYLEGKSPQSVHN